MPLAPYLLPADLKASLGIETADASEDARLQQAIDAAAAMIAGYCHQDPRSHEAAERYQGQGTRELYLRRGPLISVASLTIGGQAQAFDHDDVAVWLTSGSRFAERAAILITYTAGIAAEDPRYARLQLAAMLTARAAYSAGAYDLNMTSESINGVFGGGFHQGGPGSIPLAARPLLDAFVRRLPV